METLDISTMLKTHLLQDGIYIPSPCPICPKVAVSLLIILTNYSNITCDHLHKRDAHIVEMYKPVDKNPSCRRLKKENNDCWKEGQENPGYSYNLALIGAQHTVCYG